MTTPTSNNTVGILVKAYLNGTLLKGDCHACAVEYAFECGKEGYSEEAEYAGLMAVVDVLADIHQIDLTATTEAKALFNKPALQPA